MHLGANQINYRIPRAVSVQGVQAAREAIPQQRCPLSQLKEQLAALSSRRNVL